MSKSNQKLTAILTISLFLASSNIFAAAAATSSMPPAATEKSPIYAIAKYKKTTNPLLKVAKQKATVGIIPYYVIKGKVYIFLGQELPGGKREASGTFSDFGGSVTPDGKTILQHALREFREETMGQMHLREADVLKNGFLLFKKNKQGRGIYYIFIKLSEKQYKKTLKFHTAKVRLKASGVPNSYLEKETFLWVSLNDLLDQLTPIAPPEEVTHVAANPAHEASAVQAKPSKTKAADQMAENQRVSVHTPDGKSVNILIRGYFLRDCLQNPDFPGLQKKLK